MEKLREDYKTGERLYAQDMNKITHVVNELEERTEVVDELPETGEDGVIYAVEDAKIEEQTFYPTVDMDGHIIMVPAPSIITGETIFKVGDVIKVNGGEAENQPIVFSDIDKSIFSIVANEEMEASEVIGVNSSFAIQGEHFYRIVDIFEVPKERVEDIEIQINNGGCVFAYVYQEIENEDTYNYELPYLLSVEMRILQVPIEYQVTGPVALINMDDTVYYIGALSENYFIPNIPQIGDVIKVTESNKFIINNTNLTGMCVTAVDKNILSNNFIDFITGITEASEWQKDHFYQVTGKYKVQEYINEEDGLTDETGMFTYDEVFNPEVIKYEARFLPSFYDIAYYKDLNIYKKYIWIEDHFETFDDKTDVVTSQFVNSIWKGTQEEYDNISEKNPNVLYVIIS